MGTFDGIEYLTATVETGSFAAAARRLGVTPSAVSRRVATLEGELGVQLLARTTRSLRLTEDGIAFHARCLRILEELHEAQDAIARVRKKPSGLLRVDAPIALGRSVLTPKLPAFLERYPEIRLDLTLRDQLVDPTAEGLDVLVRIGALRDSTLIGRRLGESQLLTCASPAYLRKHGVPKHPRDLARHHCLGYLREGRPDAFAFVTDETTTSVPIAGPCNANDADVLLQLAVAGRGIILLFDFMMAAHLASGALVTVLDDYPSLSWPIHALYPKNRHLLPKVRVFLEFLATRVVARRSSLTAPSVQALRGHRTR
ncbi:MAG: Transcriptional regulator, LysR family [Myxococcaceae bacterium]|nr:Transcriptional regulator, LysR family [Myxococcaceae bacterium]